MARRPNYGAEKRQKEIQRQKKKEAKAEKKRLKREGADPEGMDEGDEAEPRDAVAEAE